jgi:hypothetical protein
MKSKQVMMISFVVICVSVASAMRAQSGYQSEWLCNTAGCSYDYITAVRHIAFNK